MNSYYKCASGNTTVVVWPSITVESGFYDVVIDTVGCGTTRRVHRVTVDEAAAIVLTELGTPLNMTLVALAGMLRRWREEYETERAASESAVCYCRRCYLHDDPAGCVAV